jgi:Tfp pilus assembly protein FimT
MCRTSSYSANIPNCGDGNGYESGWIVFQDADGNNQPDSKADVLRVTSSIPNGVTIRGNTNLASAIVFNSMGSIGTYATKQTNGTVVYCDNRGFDSTGGSARVITIALGGRASSMASNDSRVTVTSCTP